MGSKNSILSEEQLDEYVQLTYLTRWEIMYILQKFQKLETYPSIEPNLTYRHHVESVITEFPELQYNPFKERIFKVFSSREDSCISFEDFLDLSSAMSINCPIRVKAAWAFKIFDFNDDNEITKDDLCKIIDSMTLEPYLLTEEKIHISDILLEEIDLQHNGGISQLEFVHAIAKMPEFATTFSFRL